MQRTLTPRAAPPRARLPVGALLAAAGALALAPSARAEDRHVGPGEAYASVGAALGDAVDGDVVIIAAGTYEESLVTEAPGVTLRADGEVVVTSDASRVLDVQHPRTTVEGLVLDARFSGRGVRIDDGADDTILRDVEVRNAGNHCVDLRVVDGVRIERSLIHHCLQSARDGCDADDCREDAHGIVGGQATGLVVVDTEIHTFSGDAIQLDSGRGTPQWDLRVERCRLWSAPLPEAIGGYAAGVNPAENAIDTKTSDTITAPASLTVIDTVAYGFTDTLIGSGAAYNIKENVRAVFDRVTVYDSTYAFRLRGRTGSRPRGATVRVDNAVVYDVGQAFRYEDGLAASDVELRYVTIGAGVERPFQDETAVGASVIDAHDVLLLGDALPAELAGGSSLAVGASAFVDPSAHDYHLADGAAPIDAAAPSDVAVDRDGNARPVGAASDVGAYEHCGEGCAPAADAGPPPGVDAGPPAGADAGSPSDGGGVAIDAGGGGSSGGDGCGCHASGGRGPTWPALVCVALFVAARRRRVRCAPC